MEKGYESHTFYKRWVNSLTLGIDDPSESGYIPSRVFPLPRYPPVDMPIHRFHLGARAVRKTAPLLLLLYASAALAVSAFTPQLRLGYRIGDQWEPAIAADGHGHVYVLYPQYGTTPGCVACTPPSMNLLVSGDNGISWHSSRPLLPFPTGQFDPQIIVDPVDRQTVYASWLQNNKRDIVVARSQD
jgi:hypothetical protein